MKTYTSREHFPEILPDTSTDYCWECGAVGPRQECSDERCFYVCSDCGARCERFRTWSPTLRQSFDEHGRLVHYGSGMIVQNERGEILLFLRRKYPFLYTIPGGHLDVGEEPSACAVRETEEEVAITPQDPRLIFEGVLEDDPCPGGADIHYWYLYHAVRWEGSPSVMEEGVRLKWVVPEKIAFDDIVPPLRVLLCNDAVRTAIMNR